MDSTGIPLQWKKYVVRLPHVKNVETKVHFTTLMLFLMFSSEKTRIQQQQLFSNLRPTTM